MGRTIKTRGIIVGETPMGEQDKRLAILCEDKGRLSAIAKGAKKPGARLASQAQLFYYCDMMLEESRGFWYLRESSVIESFYNLRQDIQVLAWASWMVETARELAVEGQDSKELLHLLLRGLKMVSEPMLSPRMTATTFVLRALSDQGLQPEDQRCIDCGRPLPREAFVSPSAGGLVCETCVKAHGDGMALSEGSLYTMRHILHADPSILYKFQASAEIQQELFRFTRLYLHNYTQREMSSLEFLRNLGEIPGNR